MKTRAEKQRSHRPGFNQRHLSYSYRCDMSAAQHGANVHLLQVFMCSLANSNATPSVIQLIVLSVIRRQLK